MKSLQLCPVSCAGSAGKRKVRKESNMDRITKLLAWAVENMGPFEEIRAVNGTVHVRLLDGRSGFISMGEDGNPVANIPQEVMV